ncbi:MAG TPA: lysophospholipid acyltransferase family protein [Terriglobia bacterium]|nr:lysophospholipid acyltransferase family protein [Terriglobia bacterium]
MARHDRIKRGAEYAAARALLAVFGWIPRRMALAAGEAVAWVGFHAARRQRQVGLENLRMAMPELSEAERLSILRGSFSNLGRLLAEFSHFPELTPSNVSDRVVYDGLENYLEGVRRGRGVLYLAAHFGAWELMSFAHAIAGHPMKFVVRAIDNPMVDRLIQDYRGLGGNVPIVKRNASREIIRALRENRAVGILMDQNTSRDEGIFVDFFGVSAATTPSVATLALRTGAAVVPAFLIWDPHSGKHRLRFDPPVPTVQTGDFAHDVAENTRRFNAVVEEYVRQYPDHWLWIHRRWKTRPEGSAALYASQAASGHAQSR